MAYLTVGGGGDIGLNPGPEGAQLDPTRERENKPFDDSVGCVLWARPGAGSLKQNRLQVNAVLATRSFKKELSKRLSNALFYCNCY